jgi:hypothetical protein
LLTPLLVCRYNLTKEERDGDSMYHTGNPEIYVSPGDQAAADI